MNSKRRVSLRELRTFCVAAEQSSFRDTALALFITPSAVSHQIKSLEEALNVQLFERLTRSIELTAAGHALFDDVSPLIAELDAVVERHVRGAARSVLRISVQPFFANELIVPELADFTDQNPDIDIKLETSDESLEKHSAAADVSIRIFRKPPDTLVAHRLFALRLVPAASPELAGKLGKKGKANGNEFPRIVHESRPNAWREWEQSSGRSLPLVSRLVRLDSMAAVARAAEQGVGAALVPRILSEGRFEQKSLVTLFPEELETRDAYYLVYRREDRHNAAIRRFADWVLQKFDDAR